jgi:hypothetical protein
MYINTHCLTCIMSRSCGSNSRRFLKRTAVYITRFAPFGNEENVPL